MIVDLSSSIIHSYESHSLALRLVSIVWCLVSIHGQTCPYYSFRLIHTYFATDADKSAPIGAVTSYIL